MQNIILKYGNGLSGLLRTRYPDLFQELILVLRTGFEEYGCQSDCVYTSAGSTSAVQGDQEALCGIISSISNLTTKVFVKLNPWKIYYEAFGTKACTVKSRRLKRKRRKLESIELKL